MTTYICLEVSQFNISIMNKKHPAEINFVKAKVDLRSYFLLCGKPEPKAISGIGNYSYQLYKDPIKINEDSYVIGQITQLQTTQYIVSHIPTASVITKCYDDIIIEIEVVAKSAIKHLKHVEQKELFNKNDNE